MMPERIKEEIKNLQKRHSDRKVVFGLLRDEDKLEELEVAFGWLINSYLENKEELEKLKSETFEKDFVQEKNEQIKELKKQINELQSKEYTYRNFSFSEDELAKAFKWVEEHYRKTHHSGGCSGGNFIYSIIPTGIGVIKEVKCTCGESCTIQGL